MDRFRCGLADLVLLDSNGRARMLAMLTDELKAAVRRSGKGVRELARESGLAPSQITRFMAGREVYSETLNKLVEALGLTLTPKRTTTPAKRPARRR